MPAILARYTTAQPISPLTTGLELSTNATGLSALQQLPELKAEATAGSHIRSDRTVTHQVLFSVKPRNLSLTNMAEGKCWTILGKPISSLHTRRHGPPPVPAQMLFGPFSDPLVQRTTPT